MFYFYNRILKILDENKKFIICFFLIAIIIIIYLPAPAKNFFLILSLFLVVILKILDWVLQMKLKIYELEILLAQWKKICKEQEIKIQLLKQSKIQTSSNQMMDFYCFDKNEIKFILKKCHPDLNKNNEVSKQVTQKLLKQLEVCDNTTNNK